MIIWKGSPNHTPNRQGQQVKKIILHWFGIGTLSSANTRFQNASEQASAHYGISGNTIWQWVKDVDASWAAGNFQANLESINIEHDATTTKNASDATYKTSARLVASLCLKYNLPLDRQHIIGHNEVVKTACPGTLDLDRIIREAKELISSPINDQTRIPDHLTGWITEGVGLEIQQIRGLLGDFLRVKVDAKILKKDYDGLMIQSKDLARQLAETAGFYGDLLSQVSQTEKELEECKAEATKPCEPAKTSDIEEAVSTIIQWLKRLFTKEQR